jgi:hypothetical protein
MVCRYVPALTRPRSTTMSYIGFFKTPHARHDSLMTFATYEDAFKWTTLLAGNYENATDVGVETSTQPARWTFNSAGELIHIDATAED